MQLKDVPGLEPDQLASMRATGVSNLRQLLSTARQDGGLAGLAQASGLPIEALQDLVRRAELSQLQGIGPRALAQLLEAGVRSLSLLAHEEPAALQHRLRRCMDHPPNLAIIEHWITQAKSITDRRRAV
jgi:hypothetical protein